MYNVEYYFHHHNIATENIKYITRENKRTVIYLFDGRSVITVTPQKEILEYIGTDSFLTISKGVIVNKTQIVHISNEGIYTMTDGRTFQGRKRYLGEHRKNRKQLSLGTAAREEAYVPPMGLIEKCSVLEKMPLAFCVIELVFDADGHGVDFVFRYCNKAMENIEGKPIEDMLNRSFYEVFAGGDKKWLVTYADVAINGTQRTISDYSREVDKHLTIYCFQPMEGYCACILLPS